MDGLELSPTDALSIDTQKLLEFSAQVNTNSPSCKNRSQYEIRLLKHELEIHRLEAQISLCQYMLDTDLGDHDENEKYIAAAAPIYHQHVSKMLRLQHINEKMKYPPAVPIRFSVKEVSELYWVLAKTGSIEVVTTEVEQALRSNKERFLVQLRRAPVEGRELIEKVIGQLNLALSQWRVEAERAVNERCLLVRDVAAMEVRRDNWARMEATLENSQ